MEEHVSPAVNHPSHYNQGNIETIEMIKEITNGYTGFEGNLVGNVIKYLDRAPYKESKMQDIKKAQFYLNRLVDELEGELEE